MSAGPGYYRQTYILECDEEAPDGDIEVDGEILKVTENRDKYIVDKTFLW